MKALTNVIVSVPADVGLPRASVALAERAAVALLAGLYFMLLRAEVPNGDGRVYIRLIEAGSIVWNPNHLLMQPIGLAWYSMVRAIGGWSVFAALQVLSGVSAVVAILIVHSALPLRSRALRLMTIAAVFFSAHFLSMAIAEEFYMVQMPVIAGMFYLGLRIMSNDEPERDRTRLILCGVLAAIATLISINNVILAVALGPLLAYRRSAPLGATARRVFLVWIPGAIVGLPVLLGAYAISGVPNGIVTWLTSYQGDASSPGNTLYGVERSLSGLVVSIAKLAFGFINSIVQLGELGSIAEAVLRSRPLEFRVNVLHTTAMGILFVTIGILMAGLGWWLLRAGPRRAANFALGWIASFLVFNFIFSDNSDQFWMQVLPALWLLMALFVADAPEGRGRRWRQLGFALVVVLLAVLNTASVPMARAFTGLDANRAAFQGLLQPDDLLVTTGWDDLLWITGDDRRRVSRVLLMDLAAASRRGEPGMDTLRAIVDTHIAGGHRVLVARLYDLDGEGRPWEQLAKLGWPRRRIQDLLSSYTVTPVATIGGVTIRQVVAPRSISHTGGL